MNHVIEYENASDQTATSRFLFSGTKIEEHVKVRDKFLALLSDTCDAFGAGQFPVVCRRGFSRFHVLVVEVMADRLHHRTVVHSKEISRHGNRSEISNGLHRFEKLVAAAAKASGDELHLLTRRLRFIGTILVARMDEFLSCIADDRTISAIMRFVEAQANKFAAGEFVDINKVHEKINRLRRAGSAIIAA